MKRMPVAITAFFTLMFVGVFFSTHAGAQEVKKCSYGNWHAFHQNLPKNKSVPFFFRSGLPPVRMPLRMYDVHRKR